MTLTMENLLLDMKEERKKTKSEEDDFVHVQEGNIRWPKLFETYFLTDTTRLRQTSTCATSDDDLVFYVTRTTANNFQDASRSIEVFRCHDEERKPKLTSRKHDWEETTNLNLVLHQFEYTVTIVVCIKTSSRHLQILNRLSTRVYANPSRRDMRNKGTQEIITYPNIYFIVDNFEDTFCEMVVNEGQMVCVELIAKNPELKNPKVLFLGSIKYEALKQVYDTRATTSTRVAQRVSLGMYTKQRVEFVKMRGPNGKGHAQMAVSLYRSDQSSRTTSGSNATTPTKPDFDEDSWSRQQTNENDSASQTDSSTTDQEQNATNGETVEVESTDIRQELSDNTGGFLGRTLGQAMNWVRGSNSRLNQPIKVAPLQTCLTYLTLPCHLIVQDILESDATPLLSPH